MPPDAPWGESAGNQIELPTEEAEKIHQYGRRETYRIWGGSLTNAGMLLLLVSAFLTPPEQLKRWIIIMVSVAVVWVAYAAVRGTRRTMRWVKGMTHFILGGGKYGMR